MQATETEARHFGGRELDDATVENVWLMCRTHNALMAERDFGRDFILQMRRAERVNHPTVPEPSHG